MSYLSERKYWAVSPSLSVIPNLCLFFICPVEQVPSLSLERLCSGNEIFSAADKTMVIPCRANGEKGEENLTGPIRLRSQNGTAV